MPITIPSLDTVVSDVRAFFRNRFPGRDDHSESFLGKLARAIAASLSGLHASVLAADNDAVPSSQSSDAAIEKWAETLGVPADADGNYGREGATVASGGVGALSGTNGTIFPAGSIATAPDGVTLIQLQSEVTIPGAPPGTGTASGTFNAITAGTAGNLDADTVCTWQETPPGADSTFELTTALTGATDTETASSLLARTLTRLQQPPKGGAAVDWRTWAESIDGVERAYVYPNRGGLGTVHTVITQSGTGTSRRHGQTVQTAVTDYIDGNAAEDEPGVRPVTVDGYETLVPYMSTSQGLAIRTRLTPSLSKYDFDWSLGSTVRTVLSYSSGVITLNDDIPASLQTAVDAYLAGTATAPRLQVISTGSVINEPVRVVAYNTGADTLTLEDPLPDDWVTPTVGDAVYPYGPIVETIANDLLDYVDSLGPSRQGGYANPLDSWEDECAVARLTQVALTAEDSDGTRLARDIVTSGVTINGATTDITAGDTGNGPEMLYAASIAVTD